MGGGNLRVPLVSASIHRIVSSQKTSFKLGTAKAMVGEMIGDELPGIVGQLYKQPTLVPVRISVDRPVPRNSRGRSRSCNPSSRATIREYVLGIGRCSAVSVIESRPVPPRNI